MGPGLKPRAGWSKHYQITRARVDRRSRSNTALVGVPTTLVPPPPHPVPLPPHVTVDVRSFHLALAIPKMALKKTVVVLGGSYGG